MLTRLRLASGVLVAVLVAGCSSSSSTAPATSAPAPSAAAPNGSPAAAASAAPSASALASAVSASPSPAASAAASPVTLPAILVPSPSPAGPMTTVTVAYTAVTGAYSALYTAIDAGYFADEGINVQLTSIANTSGAIAGLLSGGADLSTLDGASTAGADVTGADLRLFIALTNHLAFSLMVQPNITSAADLRGKTIGETTPGSSADTAAHQALQVLGLNASDVTFQPLQTNPAIVAGLQTHQIDAGILSPPSNAEAASSGAKEMVNLATQGPPFLSVGIGGRESYINSHQTLVQGFVRAYSRGVARFKTDKAYGMQIIEKYLQVNDPAIAEDTWNSFYTDLASVPLPDTEGMQNAIQAETATQPGVAGTSPDQYLDLQYVQNLIDQGYYQQLGMQ